MKEQLKELKDSTIQIFKEKDSFRKQKMFFNMKVEEKKNELNMDEVFNDNNNSYEAAKILNEEYPNIYNIVSKIREQHPKYGEKKLKELIIITLEELKYQKAIQSDFDDSISEIIDNYFIYESCGFFKLKEHEELIKSLEDQAGIGASSILDESKETAKKAGASIVKIVKPYGEVAKSQLGDAKKMAKGAVNKGTKQLKKLLEKIENKTNDN